jgi:uncharacterized membrane protein required for colicin V production
MSKVLAWINPFDVFIILGVMAGVILGFFRGLIRMALNLAILYVATVLAMFLYVPFGKFIYRIWGMPKIANEAMAFIIILLIVTAILNVLLRRTYKDTALPGVRQIDQLGGMVLGFLFATLWAGLLLVIMAYALTLVDAEAPGWIQRVVSSFNSSSLVPIFYNFLPFVLVFLKPWMPRYQMPDIFVLGLR